MCGTWLRLVEIVNNMTLKVGVPYRFVGARKSDFGTNALTVVKSENSCALLTRYKWIVFHFALLSDIDCIVLLLFTLMFIGVSSLKYSHNVCSSFITLLFLSFLYILIQLHDFLVCQLTFLVQSIQKEFLL